MNHFVSLADSLTLTGMVTALTVIVRNLSDSIGLTGIVNRTLHAIRSIADNIPLLDNVIGTKIIDTEDIEKKVPLGGFSGGDSVNIGGFVAKDKVDIT